LCAFIELLACQILVLAAGRPATADQCSEFIPPTEDVTDRHTDHEADEEFHDEPVARMECE
jgi:hypothetical protein